MKIKKVTGNSVGNAVETVLGVAVGAMLSNGVSEIIPIGNKTAVKALVAGAGILGAAVIGGDDTLSKLARNASIGMAGQQGKEIIVDTVKPMLPAATGSGVNKFLHDVFESSTISEPALSLASPMYLANPYADESQEFAPVNNGFATA